VEASFLATSAAVLLLCSAAVTEINQLRKAHQPKKLMGLFILITQ
jgi:hypothetical protein